MTRTPKGVGARAADVLREQVDYYRAVARDYDQWFYREGRFDHGDDHRRVWQHEIASLRRELLSRAPFDDVLEIACGTGLWTQLLASSARCVTAVDVSPEMLERNRARVASNRVRYVQTDAFEWTPDRRYGLVFFSFWLSHVPPERFRSFWRVVGDALAPDGTVVFIDSRRNELATAVDQKLAPEGTHTLTRRLSDGKTFEIFKVFYDPVELEERLAELGWTARVRPTPAFFLYGEARRI